MLVELLRNRMAHPPASASAWNGIGMHTAYACFMNIVLGQHVPELAAPLLSTSAASRKLFKNFQEARNLGGCNNDACVHMLFQGTAYCCLTLQLEFCQAPDVQGGTAKQQATPRQAPCGGRAQRLWGQAVGRQVGQLSRVTKSLKTVTLCLMTHQRMFGCLCGICMNGCVTHRTHIKHITEHAGIDVYAISATATARTARRWLLQPR